MDKPKLILEEIEIYNKKLKQAESLKKHAYHQEIKANIINSSVIMIVAFIVLYAVYCFAMSVM